jgi:beta-N-acetylhexosaminidase
MRNFPTLNVNSEWVEKTLSSLSLEQKIGQLLHPCIQPSASIEQREKHLAGVEPGGMFLFSGRKAQFAEITDWFQERSPVPLVVSADLENGAGEIIEDATSFPSLMSLGAANDDVLAYEMGRAAAREGRACGVHWSFGPVVDINANPNCPGTNTRSLGDDPDRIASLSKAMVRGMQENGLCATVKHYPGGGFDDRDQHITNTINPLRTDQWFALSGRMFKESINIGVWSVMAGHISLPSWDPGEGKHIQFSPPATLSKKIMTGLLRERLGFNGVIITDALDMGGVTSWASFEELIPGVILAGCDMILFSEPKRDFDILKKSLSDGHLTEARIDESVHRILALKEALGLHQSQENLLLSQEEKDSFQHTSVEISEKALTLVADRNQTLPLKLEKGMQVLSYHLRGDPKDNVDTFDDLLRERGVKVDRFTELDDGNFHGRADFSEYDAILINVVLTPSWGTGRIRPAGNYMREVWGLITSHHPRLVLVSYGSPYMSYEMPHLPTVVNAYSPDYNTQLAVMRLLTGEIKATGTSPIDFESPYLFKTLDGLRYKL